MHRNRLKRKEKTRTLTQLVFLILFNGYLKGYMDGKIYNGALKNICVPVLNCHSCPGAFGACPLGALQAELGKGRVPLYTAGFLFVFGAVFGRIICGFMCPFGFLQDILGKIKKRKVLVPQWTDKVFRKVKYIILIFIVVILPFVFSDNVPIFCKYLCPSGTLEAGIFHVAENDYLKKLIGVLFSWKMGILFLVILGSVFIERFFCKYLCPLGALYSFFNKISIVHMTVDEGKCTQCDACVKVCPMGVDVKNNINSFGVNYFHALILKSV